ncbi:hypothetical protein MTR67_001136 [Solanum verrucosum]|uniref:Uncharacterized protein n=1 Tax=Solanum verrucosum TaxID=315347 RepID=A0AAF0PS63_SOLVR|nr:hypothetical protein MTR67_001136 [Solanum verrucosum]
MGATGTGKSPLSVDLATHFRGEIINSDKMQVYEGLEIVTNKITYAEKQGVRHYLLEQSVLNRRVATRVDEMVNAGLVDEVRQFYIPDAGYTKGIRRSIGVPEMAKYLREEKNIDRDDESKKMILQASISSIKPKMNTFIINNNKFNKKKVVFIMGATGTGKSHLSVDLATHFRGEIRNLDKMQVYEGLEIVTNKITHAEKQGVRHYLLGEIEPDSNFTAEDFCLKCIEYIEKILKTQCVPIIVGGSNSIIEKLVEDPLFMFKHKYDSCFIWIDVEQSVLNRRVDTRVDEMVNAGLVDEVRQFYIPDADYTKGIRRSIGVPEMAKYLREEKNIDGDDESKKMILQASISSIKRNTPKMNTFIINNNKFNKKKVVFIVGATGSEKSRLSVDLATHFRGEIINSDKMHVCEGLEIVTNKITHAEKQGVRHYLLGEIEPDFNFTAEDFCLKCIEYIEKLLKTQCVPIIVRGSNSFIEKLVEDHVFMFKHKYDSCFIWIDVEQSVLNRRIDTRVDEMVNAGLVDEVRQFYIPDADYTNGIRRSIGVPEMAKYLREVKNIDGDDESKKMILQASISSIKPKMNTFFISNNKFNKKKVVFIMGATGTGKSRLSVDLATHFRGEIINSDKMQVYEGLEIVTNKITHAEKQGVRHYLIGEIEPDSNFTAEDFCLKCIEYIENFLKTQCVPFIVGGSNSFIEKLVEDPVFKFKHKYDSCFIWIDVEQSVLNRRVDTRVDEMVNAAKMNNFIINNNKFNKKKVVFIVGATGSEKSRLSVDLATHFRGEIINSDKMHVCEGLEIVTNKITHAEKQGVRHYLLGEIEPDSNFTAEDFCLKCIEYIEKFLKTQCVPIIVGGSNSIIEKLVEDPVFMFKHKYDICFIWIDVEQSVLNRRVDTRIDEMVNAGLVDEVRQFYIPDTDYTKGIRRSIGVPEMAKYLREEKNIDGDDESKKMILQDSISSIKRNTRIIICN